MGKTDNRSLDHKTLEHIRLLAVERVRAGEKPSAVAKSFGIYRTSIYKWLRAEQTRGWEALRGTTAKGPVPKLTERQKERVSRWIVGKDPRQYGFDFGLWTRGIVAQMIQDKFGVSLTHPSVGRLLGSLDITPQKPLRRAYERDETEIKKWKEETYPELRKRAKERGAASAAWFRRRCLGRQMNFGLVCVALRASRTGPVRQPIPTLRIRLWRVPSHSHKTLAPA